MEKPNETPVNEFKPTKSWFENYRKYSLDYHLVESILETIEEHSLREVTECLDDSQFIHQNFPSFSEEEMEDYIETDYMNDSLFIKNLQEFIKSQKVVLKDTENKFSSDEKKWIDENLNW